MLPPMRAGRLSCHPLLQAALHEDGAEDKRRLGAAVAPGVLSQRYSHWETTLCLDAAMPLVKEQLFSHAVNAAPVKAAQAEALHAVRL